MWGVCVCMAHVYVCSVPSGKSENNFVEFLFSSYIYMASGIESTQVTRLAKQAYLPMYHLTGGKKKVVFCF